MVLPLYAIRFQEIKLDTFSKMNTLQLRIHLKDRGETENYYRLVIEMKGFIMEPLGKWTWKNRFFHDLFL